MSVRVSNYPGHEITPRDLDAERYLLQEYKTDLRYSWAAGIAMSRFLLELKAGKIIARKCNSCGRILVPPRIFCEQCFRQTDSWAYVRDTGEVNTYSISHVSADATRLKKPLVVTVINIDGATKGMGFLHLMGDVSREDVRVGMKVEAVWKLESERVGAITDIRYFKPR
jgi:uncharacterized OB-fold protein